jgi:hypothetical protein
LQERRKEERLKEYNEITISVVSPGRNIPKGKIIYNLIEDISMHGAKIRGNILLPIDTLLKIDFTLETLQKRITAIGKVKWIKVVIKDKLCHAGVELVDTPSEATKIIKDYIAQRKKKRSGIPLLIQAKTNEPKSK